MSNKMINKVIEPKVEILNGCIYIIVLLISIFGVYALTYTLISDLIISKEYMIKENPIAITLGYIVCYPLSIAGVKSGYKEVCRYFFPKLYCNECVKKFINRKELKQILSNETFEKVAIKKNNYDEFDFYASKNWLYIGNAYIPKAMIISPKFSNIPGHIELELLNNKIFKFRYFTIVDDGDFMDELVKSKIIPNLYYGRYAIPYDKFQKKYIKKFVDEIQSKEDFVKFVEKDYFFTKEDLKPEFLKEPLMKEKVEYIRGEDGKCYKKYTNGHGEIFYYEINEEEEK